jgi:hypothetical protein
MTDPVERIEPIYNAVVIHLVGSGDKVAQRMTIECKDDKMLPKLQELARRYHGAMLGVL